MITSHEDSHEVVDDQGPHFVHLMCVLFTVGDGALEDPGQRAFEQNTINISLSPGQDQHFYGNFLKK